MGLWVLRCKSSEITKGRISRSHQILVEAKFFNGQDVLSAPCIITSDGEQACVKVGRETPVPGQDQPVEAGVTLTLTARLERGRIIFWGFCQIKKPDGIDNNDDISIVAFYAREAFFEGIANLGELKQVKVNHKNGQSLVVT